MADTVLATTIAHEIQLIRYSKTLGKDAGVYVDNIMKALREELLSTDKVTTKKQRDELIKFINELFASELGDWNSELESDLTRLIKEEAKFYQASLASLIDEKVARPTLESITKAAYNTEMVLNGQAYTVNERIKQYDVNSVDKVKRIVTGGWRDGLTTYEMMQQINGKQASSVGNQMRKGANILAKDLTSHISSTAKTKVGMDNSDIVIGEQVTVTLDSRTSPICQRLGSQDGGGKKYYYADDGFNFPRPPFHWNACARGTMITTECGLTPIEHVRVGDKVLTHMGRYKKVTAVMAKNHSGKIYKLNSEGTSVTLTDEHPVLTTNRGWVRVGELSIKDKIIQNPEKFVSVEGFSSSGIEQASLIDSHNIVTKTVEELVSYEVFSFSTGVSSSVNLDDPIVDDKVTNVLADGNLKFKIDSSTFEDVHNNGLVKGGVELEPFSLGFGDCFGVLKNGGWVCNLHSVAMNLSKLFGSLFVVGYPMRVASWAINKNLIINDGLLSAFGFYSKLDSSLSYGVVAEASFPLDASKTFTESEMILLDKSCDFFIADFTSHVKPSDNWRESSISSIVEYNINDAVFNISVEDDETYVADGILVHNCRSTMRYILAPEYEELEESRTRPAIVDGKAKRVDSEESWMELAKNNPNLARESLGVERAKVLDAMSADEFTKIAYNRLDQLITIDELVKKSKAAAKALGRE
ncbi:hedgehog/hint domain protein [Vibrio phage 1.265.O._10N.286.52.F6]|nr:hedgehog/hint domain protein [Vibrio phage 1.265.O._10N.286.52.F6]